MSKTFSTMYDLGAQVPDFILPDVISGEQVSLHDFNDKRGTVIIFMCNHCPYVKKIKGGLTTFANDFKDDIGVVAINSNDVEYYPQDRPEMMRKDAEKFGYPFPYLFDESQEVAKTYRAACTPDIYLVDENYNLVYRGQFDGSRPANEKPVTGDDLREAVNRLLNDQEPLENQQPSMGCNIKWKKGNEPDYYG